MLSPLTKLLPNTTSSSDDYRIVVFVTWMHKLVEMTYPCETNVWKYRQDCGSYSQHRWSIQDKRNDDVVQMVVKHNSCLNALHMQPLCRNCVHRAKWRASCSTPENVFYLLAIQPQNECNDAIFSLVHQIYPIDSEGIASYLKSMPHPVFRIKIRKQNDKTQASILKNLAKIRKYVYELNQQAKLDHIKNIQDQEVFAVQNAQNGQIDVADPLSAMVMASMASEVSDLLEEIDE